MLGSFGVTPIRSGPLNPTLKEADGSSAQRAWPVFRRTSQFRSVIRVALGIAAFGTLVPGALAT